MSCLNLVTVARFSQRLQVLWPWASIASWSAGEGVSFTRHDKWGAGSYSATIILRRRSVELHVNTREVCSYPFKGSTVVDGSAIELLVDALDRALRDWLRWQPGAISPGPEVGSGEDCSQRAVVSS